MRRSLLELPLLVFPVAVFIWIASYQIQWPGFYYDEAIDVLPTIRLMQGRPVDLLRGVGIQIAGYSYPVMIMEYVGPINTYALVPVFERFGMTVDTIRMTMIAFAALAMGFAWLFTRALLGPITATLSGLLLAVHPSFIFWSRQGIHVTSVMSVFLFGALALLAWWWRSRRPPWFWFACLLLGLGLTAKFLFLWFIVAIAVFGVLLQVIELLGERFARRFAGTRPAVRPASPLAPLHVVERSAPPRAGRGEASLRRGQAPAVEPLDPAPAPARATRPVWRLGWRELLPGAVFFALGAAPLIYFNLTSGGTLDVLTKNAYRSSYGVDNLAFSNNLAIRVEALRSVLQGDHFWFLGAVPRNELYWTLFLGALVLTALGLATTGAFRERWKSLGFIWLFPALVLVQSTVTLSSLQPTHFYPLLPLPQIAIAAAFVLVVSSARRVTLPRFARVGVVFAAVLASAVALVTTAAWDVTADLDYHHAMARTGGLVGHSDAIYGLVSYLREHHVAKPVVLDWGIAANIEVLTAGEIQPEEIFLFEKDPPPLFDDLLYKHLVDPTSVYIFRADDIAVFPRRARFEYWVQKLEKTSKLEATVRQRDGKALYLVYTAT